MRELATALLALRERLNDETLGQRVEQGRFQLVRVTYKGRHSTVKPLSPWADYSAHLQTLQTFQS